MYILRLTITTRSLFIKPLGLKWIFPLLYILYTFMVIRRVSNTWYLRSDVPGCVSRIITNERTRWIRIFNRFFKPHCHECVNILANILVPYIILDNFLSIRMMLCSHFCDQCQSTIQKEAQKKPKRSSKEAQ